ncbi:MAG: hypothetical protein J2P36_03100 [Ktedonobacteraceae bacterium]|nr:hypothetical protein [Ktedonobacteraceae bacterium]
MSGDKLRGGDVGGYAGRHAGERSLVQQFDRDRHERPAEAERSLEEGSVGRYRAILDGLVEEASDHLGERQAKGDWRDLLGVCHSLGLTFYNAEYNAAFKLRQESGRSLVDPLPGPVKEYRQYYYDAVEEKLREWFEKHGPREVPPARDIALEVHQYARNVADSHFRTNSRADGSEA